MKKMNLKLCNNSDNLLADAQSIIDFARQEAFRSINITMVQRNWLLGKRISEEILLGENRAEYGREVIKNLSRRSLLVYMVRDLLRVIYITLQDSIRLSQTYSNHRLENLSFFLGPITVSFWI